MTKEELNELMPGNFISFNIRSVSSKNGMPIYTEDYGCIARFYPEKDYIVTNFGRHVPVDMITELIGKVDSLAEAEDLYPEYFI